MAIETKKLPYEILVRFDENGRVRGAHVIWAYKTSDGDRVVSYAPGGAEPAGAGGADFPLADVVTEAVAGGLQVNSDLVGEVAELKRALAKHELNSAAAIDAKDKEIASLKAMLSSRAA